MKVTRAACSKPHLPRVYILLGEDKARLKSRVENHQVGLEVKVVLGQEEILCMETEDHCNE